MNWSDICSCGVALGVCPAKGDHPQVETDRPIQPIAPEGGTGEGYVNAGITEDFTHVHSARKAFARLVEKANETGDTSELDRRVGRFIRET